MIFPKLDVGNREASALGVFGEGKYMKEETRRELYIVFLLGHIKLGKGIYGNYVKGFV